MREGPLQMRRAVLVLVTGREPNDFVAEGGPSSLSLLVARASFGLRPEQLLASPRRPPFENARHTVFPLNIERRELSHSKKLSHVSPVRGTPGKNLSLIHI